MIGGKRPADGRKASEDFRLRRVLKRVLRVALALILIVAVGSGGYMIIEGWSFLDAFYMTVITLSTVGYTEVHNLSRAGELWTIAFIIGGLVTFGIVTAPLVEVAVEGTVRGYFRRRRMMREVDRMEGHYVLCGYGRVGREVAEDLAADGVSFVIVDQNESIVEECLADGYRAILGEASSDEVLEAAGTRRARGLIATVDSDADNVFVTLSARKMNPNLHIVARSNSDESSGKLTMAGANRTLSPYSVGGRRLASLATRPSVVDFLDIVSRGEAGIEFRLEEFVVPKGSSLASHVIGELDVAKKTGARILAVRSKSGNFNTNPTAQDEIASGDTLIVLGTPEQVASLERLIKE